MPPAIQRNSGICRIIMVGPPEGSMLVRAFRVPRPGTRNYTADEVSPRTQMRHSALQYGHGNCRPRSRVLDTAAPGAVPRGIRGGLGRARRAADLRLAQATRASATRTVDLAQHR